MRRRSKHYSYSPAQRAALDALFEFADKSGANQARFPPFESMYICKEVLETCGISSSKEEELDDNFSDALAQVCIVLDVLRCYLANLASIQFVASLKSSSLKRKATLSLLSGMATDIGSARLLIIEGFDAQARSLIRTFGERLDLLIACQVDAAFAAEFVRYSSIDEANEFWRRNVARGKIVDRISTRLQRLFPGGSPVDQEWRARRKEMSKWLSIATHPSYLSGWFSFLPSLNEEDRDERWAGDNGLFGQVSNISIATGRASYSRVLEFMFMMKLRKNFFCPADDIKFSKLSSLSDKFEDFLWHSLSHSYFIPNQTFFKAYLAILGFQLVPQEEVPE